MHLRKAGANVNFFSFVGNDKYGRFILQKLKKEKNKCFCRSFKKIK